MYQDFLNESGDEIKAMVGDCNVYINGVFDEGEAEIEIMIAESNVRGKGLAIVNMTLDFYKFKLIFFFSLFVRNL